MNCPVCKASMRCTRSMPVGDKIIREYRCCYHLCGRKFMSEELFYHITEVKGKDLNSELNTTMYERYEKTPPELRAPIKKAPKKRKVTPKPKRVDPEKGPYLTYGDIIEIFRKKYPDCVVNDYRPYPLKEYSIIIWALDKENGSILEVAFQYNPETTRFIRIENAKTYEEILREKGR